MRHSQREHSILKLNTGVDRSLLSERENEILELATEGLTDQQIAIQLGNASSTVNSYWVRIRGKLGYFSRAGLVATALRQQAHDEISKLRVQIADGEQREIRKSHCGTDAECSTKAFLNALPEPICGLDADGTIHYVNPRLEALLGYEANELRGQPSDLVIPPLELPNGRFSLMEHLGKPGVIRLGVGNAVFAARKDRTMFQVIVLLGTLESAVGQVTSCILRSYIEETEIIRKLSLDEMRQPSKC